ncbi:hypothetical protein WN51_09705 [Melipona quadrifasciata]|uniref:Uncharacterized protein n=1 Tax=Melipona quadrifasciata TaxID=166423 RepID=A0A0M9A798_9HYME|nr:hypothetical protein WN51_09705 [Melipona quadrifasciata]
MAVTLQFFSNFSNLEAGDSSFVEENSWNTPVGIANKDERRNDNDPPRQIELLLLRLKDGEFPYRHRYLCETIVILLMMMKDNAFREWPFNSRGILSTYIPVNM